MSEKTEKPTAKRLRKARQDGDIAKSAEFTGVGVMLTALGVSMITMRSMGERLIGLFHRTIQTATAPTPDMSGVGDLLLDALATLGSILAPILAASFAVSALLTYLQTGPVFTIKRLIPDTKKIDPVQGAKSLFNKDKLVELIKNLLKIAVMALIGYAMLEQALPDLLPTTRGTLPQGMAALGDASWRVTSAMLGALVVFGVVDILWQRHKHTKKLMMSKDEIKREYKESEGDPMIKGKRKQLHQEMLRDAGTRRVKDADAVVVNPTHIAVAIQYDASTMDAPTILTSGRGERAKMIKALARKHSVPIVKQIPLARALVEVDPEHSIPPELYEGVAHILRFVYNLKRHDS